MRLALSLELRPLPSPALPSFVGITSLSATPKRPACSSRASGLAIPGHAMGLPVLRALSLCTCCRHYPDAADGRLLRSFAQPYQPSPVRRPGRPAHNLFEVCTAFTCVAACTLALSPIRDTLSEGFSHFVSSMTAPVASGGSEFAGWACTHWKAPPCHGARRNRSSRFFAIHARKDGFGISIRSFAKRPKQSRT